MTALITLDALGPGGTYHAHSRLTIDDVAGNPVAELSMVPKLYVSRAMSALRRAPTMPVRDRIDAINRAGELFATGTIAGQTASQYERTVTAVSGMPISVVLSAANAIRQAATQVDRSVQQARPCGAVDDWRDPATGEGSALWTRRGRVFAVHAAGNHPGVHALWLEALALGYRVAVRPSRREPFTPHRMVSALREAGFRDDQVVLLPTNYHVADEILHGADLGMVYGGQDVIDKYADDPTVLAQGPGRSKILITAETDWRPHLDTIVKSISDEGGTACVNATAVLVEGDPAPLAQAIAERLAGIPTLRSDHENALLPMQPLPSARALEEFLRKAAAGSTAWLGGQGVVEELPEGGAVLRPAVHQVDSPMAPALNIELPFPCVWVGPWTREAGVDAVKNTLALTALTHDTDLIDELADEPTIANLYLGDNPTSFLEPGLPHDDYLARFLMQSKAFIRK